MACRGAQRHVGGCEQLGPVLAVLEPFQELGVQVVTAREDVDRAQQVGEGPQVTAALEDKSRGDSREVENRSMLILTGRGHEIVDAPNYTFERARAEVEAIDAGVDEQAAGEQLRSEIGGHGSVRPSAKTTAAARFPSWLRLTAKSLRQARLASSAA